MVIIMLYKYYSDASSYALTNLKNNNISLVSIESLNDPFEGIGKYVYSQSEEEQQYWNEIGTDVPKLVAQRFSDDLREVSNFSYRVFCCTRQYDNMLMWSHYANGHKGFCVGYCEKSILKLSDKLMEVKYSDEMTSINDYGEEAIINLLSTKSRDWCYEKEWRLLYRLSKDDVEILNFPDFNTREDDSKIYVFDGYVQTNDVRKFVSSKFIIKECIPKEIYLGLRMPANTRSLLLDLAKVKQLKIYQMYLENDSFVLKSHLLSQ